MPRFQESLGVEGSHAACAGCRHRLSIGWVLHVAAGEEADDVGLCTARLREDITAGVEIDLILE